MNKVIAAVIVLVVLVGGAYALTRDTDNSRGPASSNQSQANEQESTDSSSSAPENVKPVATSTVEIKDFAFSPANITVKKGTTVKWTNQDSTQHDVKETDGKTGPASELLGQGESYSFTYNEVGTFKYFCSVHPSMTGTVTVTE